MPVQVHANAVDESIVAEFKILLFKRFGKLHGVFGPAIAEAMELYIEKYSNPPQTHTHQNGSDTKRAKKYKSKSTKKLEDAKKQIASLGYVAPKQEIRRVIQEIWGYDQRTFDTWYAILSEQIFIRPHPRNSKLIYFDEEEYLRMKESIEKAELEDELEDFEKGYWKAELEH